MCGGPGRRGPAAGREGNGCDGPYGQTGHTRIEGPLKTFDAISRQHNHILQRLVYFTNVLINELVSSNRELEKLSSTDRLTGLANRLRLDEEVARQISLAQRHAQEFSLILLDLDHFKLVNDQHGHQVGDRVLIEIAALLRQTLRNSDTAGRWGGEEFLIVLPQTSVESARKVADKLRQHWQVPLGEHRDITPEVASKILELAL